MKTKTLSLCIALLTGISVWADDVWNYNVYDDCSLNGYKAGYAPAPTDVQAVDLGLPSGIKWASCNVGATMPEDYGNYYAWGEVLPKTYYSFGTYKYSNNGYDYDAKLTKYCSDADDGDNGFTDNKTTLELEDDAAYMNWGSNWRMPNDAEWTELLDNCTWTWTTQNDTNGYIVTSKVNDNFIFLPAAGCRYDYVLHATGTMGLYFSSSLYTTSPEMALSSYFDSTGVYRDNDRRRTIRPVYQSTSIPKTFVTITLYADGCERANVIKGNAGQQVNVTAVPENEHRHFVRWADGNTENPRLVTMAKDMKLTAVFAFNQYTISTEVNDTERGSVSGGTTTDYLNNVTLTAIPNYGYHFAYWADEECRYWRNECNTDNPRTIQVTGDATYTAVFEKNTYTITAQSANDIQGYVSAPTQAEYLDEVTLTATAQYGYHFTKWNDGNTDNPRTVQITQDITYTAYFAPNQYTISTEVSDTERGSVSGGTTTDYLNNVTLTAIANYGYHFVRWTDWNTDNPRTVQVTGDATYTAVFEKNTYTITAQSANGIQGYVYAPYQAEYLDQVSLTAYPNTGYHFTQWADGNTDNPRTVVLTCDTTFTAEFAQTFSGQCGYDLYWQYAGHTLTISGTGAMYDYGGNDMPWLLFRDTTDVVVLEQGVTHIGNNAFNGFVKLGKIDLPNTLTSIGVNAFAGCRKLYDIYAYPIEPPVADNTSFTNYNVNLYVPCDNLRDYQMDAVFGTFKYIQCMSTTDTEQVQTDATLHAAQKVFRDGQVYILRGGKTYTIMGHDLPNPSTGGAQ